MNYEKYEKNFGFVDGILIYDCVLRIRRSIGNGDTADISEKIIETEEQENASNNIEESDINTETAAILFNEETEDKEPDEKESEDKEDNTMIITVNGTE